MSLFTPNQLKMLNCQGRQVGRYLDDLVTTQTFLVFISLICV